MPSPNRSLPGLWSLLVAGLVGLLALGGGWWLGQRVMLPPEQPPPAGLVVVEPGQALPPMTLPYLTGADLVQQVRQAGSTIPAITITGYGRENALDKLHTLSNAYVLGKPFSGNELARLLGRAIRSSQHPQA